MRYSTTILTGSFLLLSTLHADVWYDEWETGFDVPASSTKTPQIDIQQTINLSEELESDRSSSGKEHCTGSSRTIAEWLNVINIGSLFDYTSQYILNQNQCFALFNLYENISVWAEPYGFYSHYRTDRIDTKIGTIGVGSGGKFLIYDHIYMGAAVGYFHTSLKGNEKVNSLYFGPTFQWHYKDGSVGAGVLGVKNFSTHGNWNLDVRLEVNYQFDPPTDFFIPDITFHPFLRIDYLNIFAAEDQNHAAFFDSKLGIRTEKVMICHQDGALTLNVSLGWINLTPFSSLKIDCNTAHTTQKPPIKNQADLGIGLVGMHVCGLLVGLEYEAMVGANAPTQSGRMRAEWNW